MTGGFADMGNDSRQRPTNVRYEVLGFVTASAAIAYLTRNAVGVAESTIRDDLGLTLEQSGWFMGAFFWSYALLQIPGGWMARQYGSKFSLILFTTLGAICTFQIGLAPALSLLLIAQILMGASQAGLFPASVLTISIWSPLSQRALACGILAMGMQVGAISSGLLTGKAIEAFEASKSWDLSWRWIFFLYAIPGIAWSLLFYLRFHNHPQSHPSVNALERRLIAAGKGEDQNKLQGTATPWDQIVTNPTIIFLCVQQACRAAGYSFFASWFPTFLQETQSVSVKDSGYLQALVFGGTLIGCLIGGWLTDFILKRTGNLRWSRSIVGSGFLFACSLLILGSWVVEETNVAVGLLAFGALFSAQVGPCAYSATIDVGGDHVPQVFGLMNMVGNLAAAATPIVVGALFERFPNWSFILLGFAGIYLVGSICWLVVDSNQRIDHTQ